MASASLAFGLGNFSTRIQSWRLAWFVATRNSRSERLKTCFRDAGLLGIGVELERALSGRDSVTSSFDEIVLPDGSARRVEIRLRPIKVDGERLVAIVVAESNLRRRREAGDLDRWGVIRSPGLPIDRYCWRGWSALLKGDRAADRQFAVLFIDLDDFKQVNDAHGHLVGDRVLVEVARRLAGCVRTGDLIVRFGGDEFVALVANVAGSVGDPAGDRPDRCGAGQANRTAGGRGDAVGERWRF